MKLDLSAYLDVQGARGLGEAEQSLWLRAAGWRVHSSPFARLRSGDCWEDPAGHLWPQPEAVVRVAQAEALRRLEKLGWRLECEVEPGQCPRVVRPGQEGEAQGPSGALFRNWSSDGQPISLVEALHVEKIDSVEVVPTAAETLTDTGA